MVAEADPGAAPAPCPPTAATRPSPARHHPDHRPARHTARLRSDTPPLAGRTHHLLAPPAPPAAHPLGTPRRHPPSLPHPDLFDHLPAQTPRTILQPGLRPGFTMSDQVRRVVSASVGVDRSISSSCGTRC